ncbi:MAG: hypothetical protein ACK4WF_05475 [Candidatus Brocadiales bacterium]
MLLKKPIAIEGRKLFAIIILGSALVHFFVIFFLPAGKSTREHIYKTLQAKGPAPISLELVEVSPPPQEQPLSPEAKKEVVEEDLRKRLQFVDTGGSPTDEEVKAETERVGEKGTLARDVVPGGSDDRPRLEGTSDAPSLGGSPGEARGSSATQEGETFTTVVVTEGASQEETPSAQAEETPEESKLEEVAEAINTPNLPQADTAQEVAPAPQEPKLAEAEVEKPPQEVKELSETEKLASQTDRPETQAPIEDKEIPLVAEAEKPAAGDVTSKEEGPLKKELEKLEVREDGLIPLYRKGHQELAYVPPWELRGKVRETTRPKERTPTASPARGKPKVAMSFNAKSLSGGDIMPMMNAAEANAQGEGSPSFTVKKDENAPYYRHIRDRISWYWYLEHGTRQEIKLETENNQPIIVEFKVYPEGVVKEVKIVQEAGNHLLASRIKDSIEATHLDRFSRFGVKEEYIDVRFNFYFF